MLSTTPRGMYVLVALPSSRAPSTPVTEPRGTTTTSAPRRSRARRRLPSPPREMITVESTMPATSRAQPPTSQLRSGLLEMPVRASLRRLRGLS